MKRFKVPTQDLLNTEVALLPGGADCHQRALITLSKSQQDILQDMPLQDVLDLVQYLVNIIPTYNTQYGISLLCDLKKSPLEVVNRVADIVNKIQFVCPTVVYAIQPKSKDLLKKLQYAIGVKSKKKNFKKCAHDVVLVSKQADLLKHFDDTQLTSEFGGTLVYKHATWVEYRMVIERLYSKIEYSMTRVPAAQDKISMLQDYDVPHKFDEACHLLGSLSDKYHDIIRELNLEGIIDETNKLINDMKSPDKSKHFHQLSNTTLLKDDLHNFQKLKRMLVTARDDLQSLWQKAEHKIAKDTEFSQHQRHGKKIIKWIQRVGLPTLTKPPVLGHDLSSAVKRQRDFENGFFAQGKDVLGQANVIVAEVDHMALEGSQSDLRPLLSFARTLQDSASSFHKQLENHHNLYTEMVQFFQNLDEVLYWYTSTIRFLPVHLLHRVPTKDGQVFECTRQWSQAIMYHCEKSSPPDESLLHQMKQVVSHVPVRHVRNKARLIIHRVKLLLHTFKSNSKILKGQALQIFRWHENILEGHDDLDYSFSDSMSDISSLNLSGLTPSQDETGSMKTRSSIDCQSPVVRSLSRTPKLKSRYTISGTPSSLCESGIGSAPTNSMSCDLDAVESLDDHQSSDEIDRNARLRGLLDDTSPNTVQPEPKSSSTPYTKSVLPRRGLQVLDVDLDHVDNELYVDLSVVKDEEYSDKHQRLAALLDAHKEDDLAEGDTHDIDQPIEQDHITQTVFEEVPDCSGNVGIESPKAPICSNRSSNKGATHTSQLDRELLEHRSHDSKFSKPESYTATQQTKTKDASRSKRPKRRTKNSSQTFTKTKEHYYYDTPEVDKIPEHLTFEHEPVTFDPTPEMLEEITLQNISPEEQLNMMAGLFNNQTPSFMDPSGAAVEKTSTPNSFAQTSILRTEPRAPHRDRKTNRTKPKRHRHSQKTDSNSHLSSEQLQQLKRVRKAQEREEYLQLQYYKDERSRRHSESLTSAEINQIREDETSYFSDDVSLASYLMENASLERKMEDPYRMNDSYDIEAEKCGVEENYGIEEENYGIEEENYGIDIHKWISDGDRESINSVGKEDDVADIGSPKDDELGRSNGQSLGYGDLVEHKQDDENVMFDEGVPHERTSLKDKDHGVGKMDRSVLREGSCSDLRSEKTIDSGITDMTLDRRLSRGKKVKKPHASQETSTSDIGNIEGESGNSLTDTLSVVQRELNGKVGGSLQVVGLELEKKRCKTPQQLKEYFSKLQPINSVGSSFSSGTKRSAKDSVSRVSMSNSNSFKSDTTPCAT